jgi:hypothetical protein
VPPGRTTQIGPRPLRPPQESKAGFSVVSFYTSFVYINQNRRRILVDYYETGLKKKSDEIIIKYIEFWPKIVEILPQNSLIT